MPKRVEETSVKELERKVVPFFSFQGKSNIATELQKRRQKAQDQGDITEEAKLCNAIGELYSQNGVCVCVCVCV